MECYDFGQYVNAATKILKRRKVFLQSGTDFDEFKAITETQPARPQLNPSFDIDEAEGRDAQGFWLAGFDDTGKLVHSQAMKIVELSGVPLLDHLGSSGDQYRIAGYDLDMTQAQVALTPEAQKICGRFAYHGELWSIAGSGGLRGTDALPLLSRIMLAMTLARLRPDHILGFISPTNACRGLAARLGYVHLEQRSVVFPLRLGGDPLEGWMVWMSAAEAAFNLRIEPEFFSRILNDDREPQNQDGALVA